PLREHPQRALAAEPVHRRDHVTTRLTRLEPPLPRLLRALEVGEIVGDVPRSDGAHGVAGRAGARLHVAEEVGLRVDLGGDAVPHRPGAEELVRPRRPQQRVPVARGIDLRRGPLVGRGYRLEIQARPWSSGTLRRIDESVSTHPYPVVGIWQVGEYVPPL